MSDTYTDTETDDHETEADVKAAEDACEDLAYMTPAASFRLAMILLDDLVLESEQRERLFALLYLNLLEHP